MGQDRALPGLNLLLHSIISLIPVGTDGQGKFFKNVFKEMGGDGDLS